MFKEQTLKSVKAPAHEGPVVAHRWRGQALRLAVVIVGSIYAIVPIWYILSAAVNPTNPLVDTNLIPQQISLANFAKLVNDPTQPIFLWLWNSVKVSSITMVIVVTLTALAAYSFSRFRYAGRRLGLLSIV